MRGIAKTGNERDCKKKEKKENGWMARKVYKLMGMTKERERERKTTRETQLLAKYNESYTTFDVNDLSTTGYLVNVDSCVINESNWP